MQLLWQKQLQTFHWSWLQLNTVSRCLCLFLVPLTMTFPKVHLLRHSDIVDRRHAVTMEGPIQFTRLHLSSWLARQKWIRVCTRSHGLWPTVSPLFTSFRETLLFQRALLRLPQPCQQSYIAFQPQEFSGRGKENWHFASMNYPQFI